MDYYSGLDAQFTPQIVFKPAGESVALSSLHSFESFDEADLGASREVEVLASIVVGKSACAVDVAILAASEAAEDGRKVRLHGETTAGVDLRTALTFLEDAVERLTGLEDPLGAVARRRY